MSSFPHEIEIVDGFELRVTVVSMTTWTVSLYGEITIVTMTYINAVVVPMRIYVSVVPDTEFMELLNRSSVGEGAIVDLDALSYPRS